ncbi:MAG: aspartate kinase [Proteocatella sp.]
MVLVHKYGGSSVATIDKIKSIAEHIKKYTEKGYKMVIVASAMGKTTNGLISLANQIGDNLSKREMDALLSTGEVQTVSLMAMALQNIGVDAISMTGFQSGFITNDVHSKAFIKEINTEKVEKYLEEGKVVVVAGFQGITEDGHITTLGRGGSDTTAVAIAAKLECDCEIYTDVDGVYGVDPRIYPKAKKIHQISYEEMMEMAASGAGVLETRCVELAKKYNVKLYLGHSLEDPNKKEGTYVIDRNVYFEDMPITGMGVKGDTAIITFTCIEADPKKVSEIFELISQNAINLDMINRNIINEKAVFSFSCSNQQADEFVLAIEKSEMAGTLEYTVKKDLIIVSLVGVGMATHTGVASKVFSTLMGNNIPYYQITTSEISISFTIDPENKEKAVRVLAAAFEL